MHAIIQAPFNSWKFTYLMTPIAPAITVLYVLYCLLPSSYT